MTLQIYDVIVYITSYETISNEKLYLQYQYNPIYKIPNQIFSLQKWIGIFFLPNYEIYYLIDLSFGVHGELSIINCQRELFSYHNSIFTKNYSWNWLACQSSLSRLSNRLETNGLFTFLLPCQKSDLVIDYWLKFCNKNYFYLS